MMEYVIPALATIIIAIIEAVAAKERKETKKQNEKSEARANVRAEESRATKRFGIYEKGGHKAMNERIIKRLATLLAGAGIDLAKYSTMLGG